MLAMRRFLNYSGYINIGLGVLVALGLGLKGVTTCKWLGHIFTTLGFYGLSGSITNVVAIIMIFDKIPFIIGSGLIEENFDGFKQKLKSILITYLFSSPPELNKSEEMPYFEIAQKLYPSLLKTSFGVMFQWLSVDQVAALLKEIKLEEVLMQSLGPKEWDTYLTVQINKLTAAQLKELVFHILDDHLQWLVFWGAALGMVIGCFDLILR